jgi:CDP-glucose 4,6-dehydratase
MKVDKFFWNGKKVLVTGHTGFKGGWLCLWLESLGAEVYGISLDPNTKFSLFNECNIKSSVKSEIADIRDLDKIKRLIKSISPEIIIHMAAQPLVRLSYESPVDTFSTNVMGTLNIFESARMLTSLKAIVNVTTDKCYENKEWVWGYRESDELGGFDPYSSSKACSEILTRAYRRSFFDNMGIGVATVRAGNVIGGGDWSQDRLVPDILLSIQNGKTVKVRNPLAIRPWQHVLEPLSGYLIIAQLLYKRNLEFSDSWNFGPNNTDVKTVSWIVERILSTWGSDVEWAHDKSEQPKETNYLQLDISKVRRILDWQPKWNIEKAIENIVIWHKSWLKNENMKSICLEQIKEYQLS